MIILRKMNIYIYILTILMMHFERLFIFLNLFNFGERPYYYLI